MGKHAILVIKNNNKYLQYYDNRWNSYLFFNCKITSYNNYSNIKRYLSKEFNVDTSSIKIKYINHKTHSKYSIPYNKIKEYTHYFYKVEITNINMKDNYKWFTYEELIKDRRIQEVNSDIVSYIKEFNM